jgi:hypothetical protein
MERPDQLRELFRMQTALNQRIGVHTDGIMGFLSQSGSVSLAE